MEKSLNLLRKIIHIDMDAFYAAVEQRDNPALKGKPVIVGGDPNSRGVVATCSYEARKFGVHSAMPSSRAKRLCPQGVFIRGNFSAYKEASCKIREIFFSYTDLVEPLSLDEAFLDVTQNRFNNPSASIIAEEIRKKIFEETELTASAGVSFNKFLAKIASDYNKPDGITIITPDMADKFIESLPVEKFFGVGKVTQKKMYSLGIKTGADLKKRSRIELINLFGKPGDYFFDIVNGNDNRQVNPNRTRKSIGKEITLKEDILDKELMIEILGELAEKIILIIQAGNAEPQTLTLKIKFFDFKTVTRSVTVDEIFNKLDPIIKNAIQLLDSTDAEIKKVRLLGLSLSNFKNSSENSEGDIQLNLPF